MKVISSSTHDFNLYHRHKTELQKIHDHTTKGVKLKNTCS